MLLNSIAASPAVINQDPAKAEHLMTPQYYLATLAKPEELEVLVSQVDFEVALAELVPSVSASEMEHYAAVQQQFATETINSKEKVMANESLPQEQMQETLPPKRDKGKGKGKGKAL
jgi:peroxin-6